MNVEKMTSVIRKVLAEKQPIAGYMNRNAAGEYMGTSASFVQKMKDAGYLEFHQPVAGGTVRYSADQLDAFMKRRDSQK